MATCYCYEFTPPCSATTEYYDCDGTYQKITTLSGLTYNVCSTTLPIVNCKGTTQIIQIGECTNGSCFPPPTTTTTTLNPVPPVPNEPTNECDVITIFPMTVECLTIDPTNSETFDGVASLSISGGTPPYEIVWETGSVGTTITNLNVGEYKATVTDSYGDFTIETTCVLTAPPAPTTTTTTSTTTLPPFGNLCLVVSVENNSMYNNQYIDFNYNGYYNEQPSWLSNDNQYFMYWNTGTTDQWVVSGITQGIIYNPNPSQPPLSGWNYLGTAKVFVNAYSGSCNTIPPLSLQLSKNDSTCTNDGSIIVTPLGGLPPYSYSLDGGITTQVSPIFQNLGPGSYFVSVIDSFGVMQSQNITISQQFTNTTYIVMLTKSGSNFNVTISPSLPAGATITYDIVYDTTIKIAPQTTSAISTITPIVLVDSLPITNPTPVILNSTEFNPCDGGDKYITNSIYTWQNITMSTSTTVSGSITNIITPNYPIPSCYSGLKSINLHLNNVQINGCQCCSVLSKQNIDDGRGAPII